MFVFARIIGVFTYTIVLLITLVLLKKIKNKSLVLLFYLMLLTIMAFNYKPYYTADLYRLYMQVEYYGSKSWRLLVSTLDTETTPVWILYCKVIYFTRIKELLPASAAMIVYGNLFYIIYRSSQKYEIGKKYLALILFFEMAFGQYLQVISGIRSMISFSIFAKCIYGEFFEEESIIKHLWLYIIAALLHAVGIAVFGMRLLYEILRPDQKQRPFVRAFLTAVVIVGISGAGAMYFRFASFTVRQYLQSIKYMYVWEYLLTGIHLTLIIVILKKNWEIIKEQRILAYGRFVVFLIIIVCIFVFNYTIFQRFAVLVSFLSLPILSSIFGYKMEMEENASNLYNSILLTSMICLLIAVTRGNLCALKFIE